MSERNRIGNRTDPRILGGNLGEGPTWEELREGTEVGNGHIREEKGLGLSQLRTGARGTQRHTWEGWEGP